MPARPKSVKQPDYKIVTLDIENAPNLGFAWGKYEQDIIAFLSEWHLLSFAYKWQHENTVHAYSLPDFALYKKEPHNDRELAKKLWDIFDEADLIIGHNILEFDCRKASSRFLFHGFQPPSPYKTVDTLKIARRHFMLNSNKLGDLATYLGIGEKMDTGGFKLWMGCLNGDKSAWDKMVRYNKKDVVLTEQVYEKLRAWHDYHPNISLASGESHCCPACGSSNTIRRGWMMLKSFKAQRWQCKDCGHWSKGARQKIQAQLLT